MVNANGDAAPEPANENPVAECVMFLAGQFEGAITSTLGGFVEKLKKEPIWANSVLMGMQQLEIAAPMDPASVLLIYQAVLATCKEFGVCRRCNGKEKVRVAGAKVACPICVVLPGGLVSDGRSNEDGARGTEEDSEGSGQGRVRPGGDSGGRADDEGRGGRNVILP